MNATKLIKLAPMLIMIAFLAYAGYSINTIAGDPDAGDSGAAKGVDDLVRNIVTAGSSIDGGLAGTLRDPFQVGVGPGAVAGALKSQDSTSADSDLLAEFVQELKLDATFLQGRNQMAIINGRVYAKGEHLLIDGNSDNSLSPLAVVGVMPAKVTLRGGDKDYVLSYPEQFALSHKPVNSPGKSMTGRPDGPSLHPSSAPRTRHSRGARAGNP